MTRGELPSFVEAVRRWREALDAAGCPERLEPETIALTEATGRVCARLERTLRPSPTYRAAAMDGYALRSAECAAASPEHPVRLQTAGSAFAIDTGGAIPPGCDAVIAVERVRVDGEWIEIDEPVAPGKNVRLPGDDVPPGVAIGWPGRRLRPIDCAALLASGRAAIDVVRRPRLAIIPTGDELVPPGSPARDGTVIDTNSTMIAEAARAIGALVESSAVIKDDDASLRRALRAALDSSDVVVLLAGSSAGRRDRAANAIAAVATIDVRGAATRPARPVILGHRGAVAVAGLPGYPVSCHFAFDAYVAPLLRRLGGTSDPLERRGRLAHAVDTDETRDEWRPATLLSGAGSPRAIVQPLEDIGGGLYRISSADARFHLRPGASRYGRYVAVPLTTLRDPDQIAAPLFVGPYDPLVEELAALAGFRCRWTADEMGEALDAGLADAVGVLVRGNRATALRALAATGRKMLVLGVRSEGVAARDGARNGAAPPLGIDDDPWAGAAAVAAGVANAAKTTRYIAQRFGLSFTENAEAAYACIWEDRPGHRFPWGIALPAALAAVAEAAPRLGWKSVGTGSGGLG